MLLIKESGENICTKVYFSATVDNDETLAMRVAFGADPPPADGDTADRINEELSSMVPSSDNNIAQATDRGPAYLPTTGVTNVIGNGL